MTGPYDDIIDLPHHISKKHPRMSRANRAAQFSPFAALTGHGAAIKETARLTTERLTLDENTISLLDMKLQLLADAISEQPQITVRYFVQDQKKTGGAYVTLEGILSRIDTYEHVLVLASNERIPIEDIIEIDSDTLRILEHSALP